MELDPVLLSRIQFGFVVAFHILFPSLTIGIAAYIAVLEGLWLKTGREKYFAISRFWTKIFAVCFGMGVVSGIVMSYQFGTNWSRFSDTTANVLGPLLGYEVLTAFFLEATFLGILLFGRHLVPRWVHFFSALMVSFGTLFSSFWILSANSWMHTPAGYELIDGTFHVTSWLEVIFNPSFPYRLTHMVMATFLAAAFVIMGVAALYLLQKRHEDNARTMLSMGMGLVFLLAPAQVLIGDLHGLNTFEYQPVKVAAMEGHWETQRGAPLILFALPDREAERNRFEVGIPKLGSLILTHDLDGEVPGLKEWAAEDRPPVGIVFWSFRIMVAMGLLMVFVAVTGMVLRLRGRMFDRPWFLKICVAMVPTGLIAILAGWVTTEVGRQPWIVYEVMRTAEGASPAVGGTEVLISLVAFFVAYAIIFSAGIYYIVQLIRKGPVDEPPATKGRPARPLSAAGEPSGSAAE
ncbi:MAG: cytochrome ubiquinol oxidase subunit I [Rhodospirillales bacterium]|nr:MAG: cytochrome ubiquinol oxidase subunit I [Rhodospirillales bacterium]